MNDYAYDKKQTTEATETQRRGIGPQISQINQILNLGNPARCCAQKQSAVDFLVAARLL